MWSIFRITDGTKEGTIDLLPYYREWLPQLAQPKGGGYWSGSTYTDGRQLFNKQLDNIIDTFIMNIATGSMLDTINLVNNLTTLLDKGVSYWENQWQTEPVWIEMRLACQPESQYAVIMDWNIPNLDELFVAPFSGSGTMEEITLILEHSLWLENAPGTGTEVEVQSGNSTSDLTDYLIDPDTGSKAAWVSNFWRNSQLDTIFVYDASGPTYTNITGLDGVALFPAVPAVGDILYVGCTSAAPHSPFDNIIFNIDTAQSGLTIVYEIWTGAAWVAIPAAWNPTDDTNSFQNTGRNAFMFDPPWSGTVWNTVAVNAITGWWVRFRITAAAAPVAPIIDELVYTNERPYIDIPEDQLLATYKALGKLYNWRKDRSEIDHDTAATDALITSVFIGSRSLSRGTNFIAYLHAIDYFTIAPNQQSPYGVICFLVSANAANATSVKLPQYNYTYYNTPAGGITEQVLAWQIGTPTIDVADEYAGTYRVFLRGREVGTAGTIRNRIILYFGGAGGSVYTSDWKYNQTTNDEVIDFGLITLPNASPDGVNSIYITIEADTPNGLTDYYYYDLVLMPVDEFAAEIKIPPGNTSYGTFDSSVSEAMLVVDSVSIPKTDIDAKLYSVSIAGATGFLLNWLAITPGELFFNINGDQRFWFFSIYNENYDTNSADLNRAMFHPLFTTWANRNKRYKALRGENE